MQLQIEHLPKLKIINFYIKNLLNDSILLLKPDTPNSPQLAKNIFAYGNIEYCLITSDLMAVKYLSEDMENLRLLVMAELEDFLAQPQDLSALRGEENVLDLAQAVADSYIRPTLNRDNGNIDISDYSEGILSIKFSGHCADCPFAQNTFNNVIIKTFNRFIPKIREVRLIK